MPSSTFFRLPEEKRQRLLDAAWEEFTKVSFMDASINKIINKANIPRGSFYQYFTDKEDLFRHLLTGFQEHFTRILNEMLEARRGDLFAIPVWAFDQLGRQGSGSELQLARLVQLFQLNPRIDMQKYLIPQREVLPDSVWERLELSRFRKKDRHMVEQTFGLLLFCTASAILETLADPGSLPRRRDMLREQVEIIQHGTVTTAPDPAPAK